MLFGCIDCVHDDFDGSDTYVKTNEQTDSSQEAMWSVRGSKSRPMSGGRLRSDDPVKLIERLQQYIAKLLGVITDVSKRRSSKRFYEKLSFEYQQSRDLPPAIRAVMEDNRMLKSFVKEWKARCIVAESEAQKERTRLQHYKEEWEAFRKRFSNVDLETIEETKELSRKIEGLESAAEKREALIAILQKKQQVDTKLHQTALFQEAKAKNELTCEIASLKSDLEALKRERRAETLEFKGVHQKYQNLKKKASNWRKQLEDLVDQERDLRETISILMTKKDLSVDKSISTDKIEEQAFVMLCIIIDNDPTQNEIIENSNQWIDEMQETSIDQETYHSKALFSSKEQIEEMENKAAIVIQSAMKRFLAKRRQKREMSATHPSDRTPPNKVPSGRQRSALHRDRSFSKPHVLRPSRRQKPNLT